MVSPQQRTVADIEAEIAAARDHLASNIASLVDQVHPKAVASRGIASARGFVGVQSARVRSQLLNSDGAVRTSRMAVIGGAVAGLLTFVLIIRAIARR